MSEETPFWGVGTPNAFRANLLMLWRDASSPDSKVYSVFDSKKEAEVFVWAAYVRGTGDTDVGSPALLETLNTIRGVKRDERDTARAKRMVRAQELSDEVGGALERGRVVYSPTFAVKGFSEVRIAPLPLFSLTQASRPLTTIESPYVIMGTKKSGIALS